VGVGGASPVRRRSGTSGGFAGRGAFAIAGRRIPWRIRRAVFDGRDAQVVDTPYDDPVVAASKRRVAELAAARSSNKEIAQTLFVTLKAVEALLASAYRRLDCGSRTQLPAVLRPAA
jgi:DNA-binding CsgD family transcriptional regulator